MFAPQDALPLPARPNLDQYKKLAKDLARAANSADPSALRAWITHWIDSLAKLSNLILTPQLPVRLEHWIDQLDRFVRSENYRCEIRCSPNLNSSSRAPTVSKAGRNSPVTCESVSRVNTPYLEFRTSRLTPSSPAISKT